MVDDCMVCSKPTLPGHVNVRDFKGNLIGRVCSSHSLKDVILDPQERFDVTVTYAPMGSGLDPR